MWKIGILEDDMAVGKELQTFLEANGYSAEFITPDLYSGKGQDLLVDYLLKDDLHLLLLDKGLPGIDGLHLCRRFRKQSDVPVIMITSNNDEMTELMAINYGADDFVAKPFNPNILAARIESVLRRSYKEPAANEIVISQEIDLDGQLISQQFTLGLLKGKISFGDKSVDLTRNEALILSALARKQGEVVSREDIIDALWDDCSFVDDNTLTVNMTRLKNKLEEIGIKNAIQTKRGWGYKLL